MYKEDVTVWTNPNFSKADDLAAIKHELKKGDNDVNIYAYHLLKNLEDIRVYRVKYDFADSKINSKVKTKK